MAHKDLDNETRLMLFFNALAVYIQEKYPHGFKWDQDKNKVTFRKDQSFNNELNKQILGLRDERIKLANRFISFCDNIYEYKKDAILDVLSKLFFFLRLPCPDLLVQLVE